ncbi:flavodoxin family protein [Clostridium sp. cel8]|jgi:multimeric flavodoxin WrbA|uniref:flavodoxin family protein n=1 Tax=unclassified Clostridium TaxID=2614128 RepID=UPI0015F59E54|nr:flavodoxin family protein [Clostridium sp. cel8]MBA5851510.1 flavodoxin family protein [Clostridium sp. cel8]
MNILVVTGSPRKGGNTEIMAEAFAQGARETGNTVDIVKLSSVKVNPCMACEYCRTHDGECIQKDGMQDIYKIMDKSDMIVYASPVYYFTMTSQIKAVIDRFYAKGKVGYNIKSAALLLNSASENVYDSSIQCYKAINRYMNWTDKGIITISGMSSKGAMKQSSELEKVREFGRSIK